MSWPFLKWVSHDQSSSESNAHVRVQVISRACMPDQVPHFSRSNVLFGASGPLGRTVFSDWCFGNLSGTRLQSHDSDNWLPVRLLKRQCYRWSEVEQTWALHTWIETIRRVKLHVEPFCCHWLFSLPTFRITSFLLCLRCYPSFVMLQMKSTYLWAIFGPFRVGAVMWALAFDHCCLGSIPASAMSGVSLLVLFCAPSGFFPEIWLIPSHQKQHFDLIFYDLLKFGTQQLGKVKNLHHQEIESLLSRKGRIFYPYRLVWY